MKFGIFYEMQLPRPWGPDSEWMLYHNALDQLELAKRLYESLVDIDAKDGVWDASLMVGYV